MTTSDVDTTVRFGGRLLKDKKDVWAFNSWDNVEWDADQKEIAIRTVNDQKQKGTGSCAASEPAGLPDTSEHWNQFYSYHQGNFFKDRHWFEHEFPEFFAPVSSSSSLPLDDVQEPFHIFEAGCGAGNSIFPILQGTSHRPNIRISGCDFSQKAIQLVQSDPRYDTQRCHVFVHDLSNPDMSLASLEHVPTQSVDIAFMVFVLSALPMESMSIAIRKIKQILKPNGLLFIRDYGLYDLAQLRLKSENWIQGNQYRRGDGTLMYFFTLEEVKSLFEAEGFNTKQLGEDKRLLVNRKRQLQMYRVWIQGRFTLSS